MLPRLMNRVWLVRGWRRGPRYIGIRGMLSKRGEFGALGRISIRELTAFLLPSSLCLAPSLSLLHTALARARVSQGNPHQLHLRPPHASSHPPRHASWLSWPRARAGSCESSRSISHMRAGAIANPPRCDSAELGRAVEGLFGPICCKWFSFRPHLWFIMHTSDARFSLAGK